MIYKAGKINENYGWEIALFHKIREMEDGIDFIDFKIDWTRYEADHRPNFEIRLWLFNYEILGFEIYYLHHREDDYE